MPRATSILAGTLSILLSAGGITRGAHRERITIVYSSEAGAYTEALEGLRASLSNSALSAVDLRSPNAEADLARFSGSGVNSSVITVGREALERMSLRSGVVPLVSTMILRAELDRMGTVAAAVHLDIPLPEVLAELKALFPRKTRVAVLNNPSQPGQVNSGAVARGRQQGFTVRVLNVQNPEELLRAVRSLNGQVDFIVCLPDRALYNSATAKPLILASLESRLLIVGFSSSFVRAGAGVGIYPDFRDIGVQAGEVAAKQLAGRAVPADQGPRKLVVAVNQRVIRLLGLEYESRRDGNVVVFH